MSAIKLQPLQDTVAKGIHSVERERTQLDSSSFLIEFGGCDGLPVCDEPLELGLTAVDQFLQLWVFWENGCPKQ